MSHELESRVAVERASEHENEGATEEPRPFAIPPALLEYHRGRSAGEPLPKPVRAGMESAFKADFSMVRVHQDAGADALGAKAYASGEHLHFGRGQYDPTSTSGRTLLGHELAHVLQQREGRVRATAQASGLPVNDDPALEREADDQGERAARGEQVARAPSSAGPASRSLIQGFFTIGPEKTRIKMPIARRLTTMADGIERKRAAEFLKIARSRTPTSLEKWLGDAAHAAALVESAEAELNAKPGEKRKLAPGGKTTAGGRRKRAPPEDAGSEWRERLTERHGELSNEDKKLLKQLLNPVIGGSEEQQGRIIPIVFTLRKRDGVNVTSRTISQLKTETKGNSDDEAVIAKIKGVEEGVQEKAGRDVEGDKQAEVQKERKKRKRTAREEKIRRAKEERERRRAEQGEPPPLPPRAARASGSRRPRGPVNLAATREEHERRAQERQPALFGASGTAFRDVIREHRTEAGDALLDGNGDPTEYGDRILAGTVPATTTAEWYFLLTHQHTGRGAYRVEDGAADEESGGVMISNKGNDSLRGEEILGLASYPNVKNQISEVESSEAGRLLHVGQRKAVIARLRELLADAKPPSKLVTRLRRQHFLHRQEQARFPQGALVDALSMLAVELGLWDLDDDYYSGRLFPMHSSKATTLTGLADPQGKQKSDLEIVHAKARLVVVEFIDRCCHGDERTRRRVEDHKIGGPMLQALVRLLEAPDEELAAATAALVEATKDLLRSPERRVDTPEGERARTPERGDGSEPPRRSFGEERSHGGRVTDDLLDFGGDEKADGRKLDRYWEALKERLARLGDDPRVRVFREQAKEVMELPSESEEIMNMLEGGFARLREDLVPAPRDKGAPPPSARLARASAPADLAPRRMALLGAIEAQEHDRDGLASLERLYAAMVADLADYDDARARALLREVHERIDNEVEDPTKEALELIARWEELAGSLGEPDRTGAPVERRKNDPKRELSLPPRDHGTTTTTTTRDARDGAMSEPSSMTLPRRRPTAPAFEAPAQGIFSLRRRPGAATGGTAPPSRAPAFAPPPAAFAPSTTAPLATATATAPDFGARADDEEAAAEAFVCWRSLFEATLATAASTGQTVRDFLLAVAALETPAAAERMMRPLRMGLLPKQHLKIDDALRYAIDEALNKIIPH